MVEFCPSCEKIMRKKVENGVAYLECPHCGFKKEYVKTKKSTISSSSTSRRRKRTFGKPRGRKGRLEKKLAETKTIILDDQDGIELLPKTKVICPKCGNGEAYYEQYQTRSADEPPTTFYICVKCKHRWREY